MEVLTVVVGVLGSGALAVIGYIAHRVDACVDSLHRMEGRVGHLEAMRNQEHSHWTQTRRQKRGDQ
jgi:hypothetical protein